MLRKFAEPALLVLLLAVVGLRPLVGESFHMAGPRLTASLEGTEDAWALATLILDVVILVAAAGVTLRRVTGGARPYRPTGLEWGTLVLVVAACISCCFAGERRPAVNASIDLLATLALCMSLVQLLDCTWKSHLALCVIIASGAANAAECLNQRFVSFIETEQMYRESREQIWSDQGVPLDSPQVQLYERRMQSREASGFFAHSNVAGGYLLLPGFAALGMAVAAWHAVRKRRSVLPAVAFTSLLIVLLGSVLLTRSKAAIAGGAAALVLFAGLLAFGKWIQRRRRAFFWSGWLAVAVGAIVFVAVGLFRGGLPHPSLDFRWHYWTASAELFTDHWPTGVGAENFGDRYLQYKSIENPEEIKNPHNFVVQIAAEYGVVGLLAAVMLLVGGSSAAAGRPEASAPSAERNAAGQESLAGWPWLFAVLAFAVFVPRIFMLSSDQPALVVWETMFALSFWATALVAGLLSVRRLAAAVDEGPYWSSALSCGLVAFLLQDTISFALFVPGARTTFFALLAVFIAHRAEPSVSTAVTRSDRRARRAGWAAACCCGVTAVVTLVMMGAPMRAERVLRTARAAQMVPVQMLGDMSVGGHPASRLFTEATQLDPLDATAPAEQARWLHGVAIASAEPARASRAAEMGLRAVGTAIDRAPYRFWLWSLKSRLHLVRGQAEDDEDELLAAEAAMRRSIGLYPTRPISYVELSDCMISRGDCAALRQAVAHLRESLELDDSRPVWERFRRFGVRTREAIEDRIEHAERLCQESCAPGE